MTWTESDSMEAVRSGRCVITRHGNVGKLVLNHRASNKTEGHVGEPPLILMHGDELSACVYMNGRQVDDDCDRDGDVVGWAPLEAEVARAFPEYDARVLADFPNLDALMRGCVSGNAMEWALLRGELAKLTLRTQLPAQTPSVEWPHTRRKPPSTRPSVTKKIIHGPMEGYLIVSFYPDDDKPCELFIKLGKEGSFLRSAVDLVAINASYLLQLGVPAEWLASKLKGHKVEPYDDESRSLWDTIARLLLEACSERGGVS